MPSHSTRPRFTSVRWPLAVALFLYAGAALALDFAPLTPDPAAFKARREKFMALIGPKSIAILRTAPTRTMSNDVHYPYRQDSDFYYLTGITEDDVIAVLRPEAADGKKYVLFLRPREPRREAFAGPSVGPDEAVAAYGADAAFPLKDFESKMADFDRTTYKTSGYLIGAEKLYVSDGHDEAWAGEFDKHYQQLRSHDEGPASLVDARGVIHEMRLIKDAEDLRFLKRAAEVSAQGHIRAMQAVAPGLWEFQVQEALDGYCLANDVRRMAYPSIVGSGPNSCILHYENSSRQIKDGEVLLNDSGAEYGMYATDITRTYPVNGHFSPEQKAIYEVVLDAQKKAMAIVKPGVPHEEIEKTAALAQAEGLVKLGLLTGDPATLVKSMGHRRFTLHGVSHWVGLDVHDTCPYRGADGKSRLLEPGMVFTIEPGVYVLPNMAGVDPKWWNIGVRIEDTVLVTPTGYECLSCGAPRELADVERTVQSGKKTADRSTEPATSSSPASAPAR
ncbi:MAG TPA: aminopeptidase P N-terminal domain-containing protein [Thermoanaerobaculia bacterium]|nr:aminopeptidase P N-terminal domain-containing protein [Thermoanaerobaculia bacterium]